MYVEYENIDIHLQIIHPSAQCILLNHPEHGLASAFNSTANVIACLYSLAKPAVVDSAQCRSPKAPQMRAHL